MTDLPQSRADRLDAHQALQHEWFKAMVAAQEQSLSSLAVDNLKSLRVLLQRSTSEKRTCTQMRAKKRIERENLILKRR